MDVNRKCDTICTDFGPTLKASNLCPDVEQGRGQRCLRDPVGAAFGASFSSPRSPSRVAHPSIQSLQNAGACMSQRACFRLLYFRRPAFATVETLSPSQKQHEESNKTMTWRFAQCLPPSKAFVRPEMSLHVSQGISTAPSSEGSGALANLGGVWGPVVWLGWLPFLFLLRIADGLMFFVFWNDLGVVCFVAFVRIVCFRIFHCFFPHVGWQYVPPFLFFGLLVLDHILKTGSS